MLVSFSSTKRNPEASYSQSKASLMFTVMGLKKGKAFYEKNLYCELPRFKALTIVEAMETSLPADCRRLPPSASPPDHVCYLLSFLPTEKMAVPNPLQ